ncbi:MAG: hypothetical protein C0436_04145 [Alphaproteobacteria bacterium]|nr:hypothetical protein [Alphaproteobacteria bacterium]
MNNQDLLELVYERIQAGQIKTEVFYGPDESGRVLIHVYSVMGDGGRCGFDHETQAIRPICLGESVETEGETL